MPENGSAIAQFDVKRSHNALLAIFASAARVAVLRVFMLDPSRAYYQRQIEAATDLPIRAVQRELERLTSTGLLYRRVEGNRTYYQVDEEFPLFPELRSMILKTAEPVDLLRGTMALEAGVRLMFLSEGEDRVLLVTTGSSRPAMKDAGPFVVEVMTSDEFTRALAESPHSLDAFLARGADLLGRRDDVIWRYIETAGFAVRKGKGVP